MRRWRSWGTWRWRRWRSWGRRRTCRRWMRRTWRRWNSWRRRRSCSRAAGLQARPGVTCCCHWVSCCTAAGCHLCPLPPAPCAHLAQLPASPPGSCSSHHATEQGLIPTDSGFAAPTNARHPAWRSVLPPPRQQHRARPARREVPVMGAGATHHPDLGAAAHLAVGLKHPAVVGEEQLQGLPEEQDGREPDAGGEERSTHHRPALVAQEAAARAHGARGGRDLAGRTPLGTSPHRATPVVLWDVEWDPLEEVPAWGCACGVGMCGVRPPGGCCRPPQSCRAGVGDVCGGVPLGPQGRWDHARGVGGWSPSRGVAGETMPVGWGVVPPPRCPSPLGQAVADAGDQPQGGVNLAVEGASGGNHDHHPAGGRGGVDTAQEAVLWAQSGGQGGGDSAGSRDVGVQPSSCPQPGPPWREPSASSRRR